MLTLASKLLVGLQVRAGLSGLALRKGVRVSLAYQPSLRLACSVVARPGAK